MKWLDTIVLKHKAAGPATVAGEGELFFNASGQLSKQIQGVTTMIEGGGTGVAEGSWITITAFGSTCSAYPGYPCQFKLTGKRIDLRGLVLLNSASYAAGFAIVNVPAPYRPLAANAAVQDSGLGFGSTLTRLRVDTGSTGNVVLGGALSGSTSYYVSLEGIHWWQD